MALTQVDQGLLSTNAQYTGFKNRIINGAMVLDQRNAGASITQTTANQFSVDRFIVVGSVASKFTAQQNAAAVTPPAGFINYLGITSSSAYTVGAAENFNIRYYNEGLNTADLGWGTASAQTVTLSFWVQSSLTGTFGGSINNYAFNRSYPYTFTINAANTWEYKTVTIAGDTSGTWLTTNSGSLCVFWNLGCGATNSGTANAWSAGTFIAPTGAVSVVGTSGATFYITGVQLEKGSTATSFDYRPYGTEFQLCQRYCWVNTPATNSPMTMGGVWQTSSQFNGVVQFPVPMRASPSFSYLSAVSNYGIVTNGVVTPSALTSYGASTYSIGIAATASGTAGYGGYIQNQGAGPWNFTFSAEL